MRDVHAKFWGVWTFEELVEKKDEVGSEQWFFQMFPNNSKAFGPKQVGVG